MDCGLSRLVGGEVVRLSALLKRPFFIAAVYAVVSWIWISVSDIFLHQANLSHRVEGIIDTAKGSVFVAVTALLMYALLRLANQRLAHANRAEDACTESEQRFRVLADNAPVPVIDPSRTVFVSFSDCTIERLS